MVDKLEILQGAGIVARFGEVAVWAGPQASPALQAHLLAEAQKMAHSPSGGDSLASSFISVLQRGDPEPQVPFAVVGPGSGGLTVFLHGPVQAWDSGRWLVPPPVPGWMSTSVARPWPLIVLPYGAPPPPQSQPGNPFDLLAGAVPGSGFVMLRPPPGPGHGTAPNVVAAPAPVAAQLEALGTTAGPAPTSAPYLAPATSQQAYPGQAPAGGPYLAQGPAGRPLPGPVTPGPAASQGASVPREAVGPAGPPEAAPLQPRPLGPMSTDRTDMPVDLRHLPPGHGRPLPRATEAPPAQDRPEILGSRCPLGHFNHPKSVRCMTCGEPILPGAAQVSGPQPSLGVLLADDGKIWALRRSCILGADPGVAGEVRSATAQPVQMLAGPNHQMAAVQAEVRVRDWSVYLVDRGAEGGCCVQGPSDNGWSQLGRDETRELVDGSHISCGGRVLTYLCAWPQ